MEMYIENLPSYRIAYVRQVGSYGPANAQAMEMLKSSAPTKNLLTASTVLFGIPRITRKPRFPKIADTMLVLSFQRFPYE